MLLHGTCLHAHAIISRERNLRIQNAMLVFLQHKTVSSITGILHSMISKGISTIRGILGVSDHRQQLIGSLPGGRRLYEAFPESRQLHGWPAGAIRSTIILSDALSVVHFAVLKAERIPQHVEYWGASTQERRFWIVDADFRQSEDFSVQRTRIRPPRTIGTVAIEALIDVAPRQKRIYRKPGVERRQCAEILPKREDHLVRELGCHEIRISTGVALAAVADAFAPNRKNCA